MPAPDRVALLASHPRARQDELGGVTLQRVAMADMLDRIPDTAELLRLGFTNLSTYPEHERFRAMPDVDWERTQREHKHRTCIAKVFRDGKVFRQYLEMVPVVWRSDFEGKYGRWILQDLYEDDNRFFQERCVFEHWARKTDGVRYTMHKETPQGVVQHKKHQWFWLGSKPINAINDDGKKITEELWYTIYWTCDGRVISEDYGKGGKGGTDDNEGKGGGGKNKGDDKGNDGGAGGKGGVAPVLVPPGRADVPMAECSLVTSPNSVEEEEEVSEPSAPPVSTTPSLADICAKWKAIGHRNKYGPTSVFKEENIKDEDTKNDDIKEEEEPAKEDKQGEKKTPRLPYKILQGISCNDRYIVIDFTLPSSKVHTHIEPRLPGTSGKAMGRIVDIIEAQELTLKNSGEEGFVCNYDMIEQFKTLLGLNPAEASSSKEVPRGSRPKAKPATTVTNKKEEEDKQEEAENKETTGTQVTEPLCDYGGGETESHDGITAAFDELVSPDKKPTKDRKHKKDKKDKKDKKPRDEKDKKPRRSRSRRRRLEEESGQMQVETTK